MAVSEPGGVVGILKLWFQILVSGTTNGDGKDSAKGSFVVPPLIAPVPVTDPVFDKVKPTFFNRKSTFCSVVADT